MLTSLYATIWGTIYRNRFGEMKFLLIYSAASFAEICISPIHTYIPWWRKEGIPNMLVNLFLFIEFIILYHYYLQIIRQVKVRIILRIVGLIYLSSMILIWWLKGAFNKSPEIFFVPQAILVLPPSLYYFIEIIRNPLSNDLKSEPTFWVVIGILLYFGCTLPLFLLDTIFNFFKFLEKDVYAINCVCYGLLYLSIIKAFLCKKREAQ